MHAGPGPDPHSRRYSPEELATAVKAVRRLLERVSERQAKGEPLPDFCTPEWIEELTRWVEGAEEILARRRGRPR